MVNKYFEGVVPKYVGVPNDADKDFEHYSADRFMAFEETFNNYEIALSLQEIWNVISRTNKYIDETMPWVLAKEGEQEKLESCIYHLVENIRKIAIFIRPFMLKTSNEILRQLGIDNKDIKWESLGNYKASENTKVISKGEPIFMRLNKEEEVEYIKSLMKK